MHAALRRCTRPLVPARGALEALACPGHSRSLWTGKYASVPRKGLVRRQHQEIPFAVQLIRPTKTRAFSSQPSTSSSPGPQPKSSPSYTTLYTGPLTRTFRNLKVFSLSSLALATSITPFMFVIESSLPFGARCALAVTAVTTSGISTMLISWAGGPYVVGIEGVRENQGLVQKDSEKEKGNFDAIRIETRSLLLQPRYTTVYDPAFLGDTRRPLAKWELVGRIDSHPSESEGLRAGEETVAMTSDKLGKVLGRWIVQWDQDGRKGVCKGAGSIQRHFNVHEELLPPGLRSIA